MGTKSGAVFYTISVVSIIISIVSLVYVVYFVSHNVTDGKEYDIFRDLLTIVLTVLGVTITGVFFMIYEILSKKLQKDAESKVQKMIDTEKARLYIDHGRIIWNQYNITKKSGMKIEDYLTWAIRETKKSFKLLENIEDEKKAELTYQAKNNLACYYADLAECKIVEPDIVKLAREYVKDLESDMKRYSEYSKNVSETISRVKRAFR